MYVSLLVIPLLLVETSSAQQLNSPSIWQTVSRIPSVPTPGRTHSYKSCGYRKECVLSYLCSKGRVTTDGVTLFDVRFDGDAICPFLETCCSIENKVEEPILRPPGKIPTGCGYRNVDGLGFKITGASANEAEYGEFPWMVAIMRAEKVIATEVKVYQNGGSIIAPHIVLTGAHCVQGWPSNNLRVRAGEWEVKSKNEPYSTQDRAVVEIIVHENFNKDNLHNDVALVFLDRPFDLAPNVNTICLPPAGYNFDYSRCFSTGWGKDKYQRGQYVNILKKIDLQAVPHAQCEANLRQTRLSKYFELHSSFMCAGGEEGKDACTGDGGSPLICPIRGQANRYYQAGIVAWGIGCGAINVPGVYASVANLRGWIDEKLTFKGVLSHYYTASLPESDGRLGWEHLVSNFK